MIELQITGCCKGCNHIDLDLMEQSVYDDNYEIRHFYRLGCRHAAVCGAFADERASAEGVKHETGKT